MGRQPGQAHLKMKSPDLANKTAMDKRYHQNYSRAHTSHLHDKHPHLPQGTLCTNVPNHKQGRRAPTTGVTVATTGKLGREEKALRLDKQVQHSAIEPPTGYKEANIGGIGS